MRIPFVTFKGSQEKGGQLSRKYLHENICLNFLYSTINEYDKNVRLY